RAAVDRTSNAPSRAVSKCDSRCNARTFRRSHARRVSGEREPVIGIRWNFTWRENASGHFIHEIDSQRFEIAFVRDEEILQCFLESARVSKQLPERNMLWIRFWDCEIEVIVNVAVKVELALFHQLHHGCGSE